MTSDIEGDLDLAIEVLRSGGSIKAENPFLPRVHFDFDAARKVVVPNSGLQAEVLLMPEQTDFLPDELYARASDSPSGLRLRIRHESHRYPVKDVASFLADWRATLRKMATAVDSVIG